MVVGGGGCATNGAVVVVGALRRDDQRQHRQRDAANNPGEATSHGEAALAGENQIQLAPVLLRGRALAVQSGA